MADPPDDQAQWRRSGLGRSACCGHRARCVRGQAARGCTGWCYSADFNEKCANVEYVLDFWLRSASNPPKHWSDCNTSTANEPRSASQPDNRMHAAAKIKPVVIDEALLTSRASAKPRARLFRRGTQGVQRAHRGAAHGRRGTEVPDVSCVQDLTCPAVPSSIPHRFRHVSDGRRHRRQREAILSAANQEWLERFPTMFRITDGTVGTAVLSPPDSLQLSPQSPFSPRVPGHYHGRHSYILGGYYSEIADCPIFLINHSDLTMIRGGVCASVSQTQHAQEYTPPSTGG